MAFDLKGAIVPVLSAGAVRLGVLACAKVFMDFYSVRIDIRFATAPQVADAVESGQSGVAVVIAPYRAFLGFMRNGRINRSPQHGVGVVRAGVVVRAGAPLPDLATASSLRTALEQADAVIYNRASSGSQVAGLMERLGLGAAVGGKSVRVETGAEVIETVASGTHGNAIGIAQSTEIRRVIGEGAAAAYAGPLPPELAIETYYMAGLVPGMQDRASRFFVRFLGSVKARDILAAHGVEPLVMLL